MRQDLEPTLGEALARSKQTEPVGDTLEKLREALDELLGKFRMVISHASGGALSEPGDTDRSINDICVEISRHKNDIWEQAKRSARASLSGEQSDG